MSESRGGELSESRGGELSERSEGKGGGQGVEERRKETEGYRMEEASQMRRE